MKSEYQPIEAVMTDRPIDPHAIPPFTPPWMRNIKEVSASDEGVSRRDMSGNVRRLSMTHQSSDGFSANVGAATDSIHVPPSLDPIVMPDFAEMRGKVSRGRAKRGFLIAGFLVLATGFVVMRASSISVVVTRDEKSAPPPQSDSEEMIESDRSPPHRSIMARTAPIGLAPAGTRGAANPVTSVDAADRPASLLPSVTPQPPRAAENASTIAAKMKIGVELMTYGEVTAARVMFQRVAEAGEGAGAFALAETYDPLVLEGLRLRERIMPDVALARTWYERAENLGSPEAQERISRLAQLPQ